MSPGAFIRALPAPPQAHPGRPDTPCATSPAYPPPSQPTENSIAGCADPPRQSNRAFASASDAKTLNSLLARDRGVGADVSVQPGFVIIMPSPLEASGAPLCCSPVDPEDDDERDQNAYNQSDMSDRMMQIFGVDKGAEITVNWSMRFGSVSS